MHSQAERKADEAPQLASVASSSQQSDFLTKEQTEAHLAGVLANSKTCRHLLDAMKQAGCKPVAFRVMSCDTVTGGGFSLQHGVILCHNRLQSMTDVENAVAHELIHAYDNCVVPGMDFSNCLQHACTEVRAAHLSGDCSLMQEVERGNVSALRPSSWQGFTERCVRRRAALSVALNPSCGTGLAAQQAVDAVLERCMKECAPFDKCP